MTEDEILKAKCNNCESSYREHGKLCPWRSISGDYCFDEMNTKEAHREIKKKLNVSKKREGRKKTLFL